MSLALLVGAGAVVHAAIARPWARVVSDGVRWSVEDEGHRYEFQAVLGAECLFDLAEPAPRANRIATRADVAARLRAALVESEGVSSLDDLRARHADLIEGLRRLGYL